MKEMYTIKGVDEEFDRVRLNLRLSEPVQEKQDAKTIMSNPMGFIEKMKADAVKQNKPESITVSRGLWEEHRWNIGDIVFIEVFDE